MHKNITCKSFAVHHYKCRSRLKYSTCLNKFRRNQIRIPSKPKRFRFIFSLFLLLFRIVNSISFSARPKNWFRSLNYQNYVVGLVDAFFLFHSRLFLFCRFMSWDRLGLSLIIFDGNWSRIVSLFIVFIGLGVRANDRERLMSSAGLGIRSCIMANHVWQSMVTVSPFTICDSVACCSRTTTPPTTHLQTLTRHNYCLTTWFQWCAVRSKSKHQQKTATTKKNLPNNNATTKYANNKKKQGKEKFINFMIIYEKAREQISSD